MKTGCHLGGSKVTQIINKEWERLKVTVKEENAIAKKESAKLGIWGTLFMYLFGFLSIIGAGYYIVNKYGLEVVLDRVDRTKVKVIIFCEERVLPLMNKFYKIFRKKVGEIQGVRTKTEKVV